MDKQLDGLTIKHGGDNVDVEQMFKMEDMAAFEQTTASGDAYETLADMLYDGLKNYAGLISMQVPKPFVVPNMEIASVAAGIQAVDSCIKQLRKDLNGGEVILVENQDLKDLPGWYADAFTTFLQWSITHVPDNFKKKTPEKTTTFAARQCLLALNRVRSDLVEQSL
jgi:hypothetical protein